MSMEWKKKNRDKVRATASKFYYNHREEILAEERAQRKARKILRDNWGNNA